MLSNASGSFETRARYFADLMVGWPSVTGSRDEAQFAEKLKAELETWNVFRDRPGGVMRVPAPGLHDRASILALVRGSGPRTIILVGHFDTVPIDDYGELSDLAGSPEDLRRAMIEKLEATGENPLALVDLKSRRFLPGRGMLDMKSGLAAGIAVLERFSLSPERTGNLLLIACPDEEENSAGMRSVAAMLPGFLARHGLDAKLAVNLDATCDNEDGATGRIVAMGCIGKLLVSALVVGKEAHACYPLQGVNAAYLAAEIVAEMEYAPELAEGSGNAFASPPTVLGLKDLKPGYNVTVPARVWCFWNVLMHRRKAAEVMATSSAIASRAMKRAGERMSERAAAAGGDTTPVADWQDIPVITFDTLRGEAETGSETFAGDYARHAAALAARADMDFPTRSRELVEFAWDRSGLKGPAVVLCIGSMLYPAILWPEGFEDVAAKIRAAAEEVSVAHGERITLHPFFPAIADMSFLGLIDEADLQTMAADTPLWGSSIDWPATGAPLGFPVVNAGPWGRDYHHWLERTHDGYTFRVLPDLVAEIAGRVLRL